jgi:hypothetical protein
MAALLDRYLVPWQVFASQEKLLSAYRHSKPVAAIVKAFSWHQTITHLPLDFRADYEWILPEVWKEFMIYEKMLAG